MTSSHGRRLLQGVALALLLGAAAGAAAAPPPSRAQLIMIEQQLDRWQLPPAEADLDRLARSFPDDPRVLQLRGRALFYRGQYDRALPLLKQAVRGNRTSARLKYWRDLVGSTAEVVKGYTERRSAGGHFSVWTSRGKDELLAHFAGETLEAIRTAMGQDLAYLPQDPIRVEVYPDPQTLARVSPLTLSEIDRSGTIALCKYNRLMIVSPRALPRGYSWRDALAHEYIHLVVTRSSNNLAPIWIQEGLAKYLESRWRESSGKASPLAPAQEHLLARALRERDLIAWSKMHPSMAKLPSQRATALAFAQVQTAMEFMVQRTGPQVLRRLLDLLREGRPAWDALQGATGLSRTQFDRQWRGYLAKLDLRQLPDLVPLELRFGKHPSKEKRLAEIKEERARGLLTLAGMLRERRLTRAAIVEYEKARKILGPRNDLVANHLARAYLEVSSPAQAISALLPVLEYYPELPGPQVTMGIAYLRNGDTGAAEQHLRVALRINPFNPELHCGLSQALKGRAGGEAALHAGLCQQLR